MVKEKPVDVSDTSDDSDSDSDTDAATATTDSVTGPGELTLVDDAVGSLVYQAPPELGEEDEGMWSMCGLCMWYMWRVQLYVFILKCSS